MAYTCSLAADELGQHYAADFTRLAIRLTSALKPALHTGVCLILVTPDGERTMKTSLGASAQLTPDIDAEVMAQAQWVYLEGYLLAGDTTRAATFMHWSWRGSMAPAFFPSRMVSWWPILASMSRKSSPTTLT